MPAHVPCISLGTGSARALAMVIKWHLHTVVLQRRSKAERPLASQISSLEMCCFDGPVALVLSFRSELVAVFEEAGRKSAISVCVCVCFVGVHDTRRRATAAAASRWSCQAVLLPSLKGRFLDLFRRVMTRLDALTNV